MALKRFTTSGTSACPECGATGSYDLLVERVRAIQEAWSAAGRYPDTSTDRAAIENAIDAAVAAIGMEKAP
jgi:hypothetical protein